MTLVELTRKWNNQWLYDYWWRQKHNVAFNSQLHRSVTPFDIKIEYIEFHLMQQQLNKMEEDKTKEKLLKQGIWIKDNDTVEDDVWDKFDVSQF